jgi:PadR family transcriptional regulator PadR
VVRTGKVSTGGIITADKYHYVKISLPAARLHHFHTLLLVLTFYTNVRILLQNIYMRRVVGDKQTNLLQGTLDLLILKALSLGDLHGLAVSRRIEQMTGGTFQVKPGSLFPALHRMEESGWLASSWGESENNRRAKYYRLTRAGRKQLDTETSEWERIALAIAMALRAV